MPYTFINTIYVGKPGSSENADQQVDNSYEILDGFVTNLTVLKQVVATSPCSARFCELPSLKIFALKTSSFR